MADQPIPDTDGTRPAWRVSDLALSFVRTYTPVAVVATLGWLGARYNLVVPADMTAEAQTWAVAGGIAVYFAAARWLERRRGAAWAARVARWVGRWALGGVIRQPVYVRPGERVLVDTEGGLRSRT